MTTNPQNQIPQDDVCTPRPWSTMDRVTTGMKLVAFAGLLCAGTLDTVPDRTLAYARVSHVKDMVHDMLHRPALDTARSTLQHSD